MNFIAIVTITSKRDAAMYLINTLLKLCITCLHIQLLGQLIIDPLSLTN